MDNGNYFLLYYSWKKLVPNLKFTPDAVLNILPKSWHIALYTELNQWWAKVKQSLSIEHSIKCGRPKAWLSLFSKRGQCWAIWNKQDAADRRWYFKRSRCKNRFSFHSRREECNSSQSSDNNVNVWREVNRRHDVDAWRFHTVQTSHWIWPGNYWSVSKLYYQVPKFPLGGVVWFSSLITLNWFKCVENAPCGSRKSDTTAHLRWSRLEAWRSGKL